MPYRVPQDYLENSQSALRTRLRTIERRALRRRTYIAAAVALLLAMAYPVSRIVMDKAAASAAVTPVYSVTSPTDNWSEFAEADIFLDSLDW